MVCYTGTFSSGSTENLSSIESKHFQVTGCALFKLVIHNMYYSGVMSKISFRAFIVVIRKRKVDYHSSYSTALQSDIEPWPPLAMFFIPICL